MEPFVPIDGCDSPLETLRGAPSLEDAEAFLRDLPSSTPKGND